jgi:LmbE family N-acetylglucosaminyl deacetylase
MDNAIEGGSMSKPATRLSRRKLLASAAAISGGLTYGRAAADPQKSAEPEILVAFGAHPADVLNGATGTLLKHALRGDRAIGVPLTLGIGHLWKPRDGSFGRLKSDATAKLRTLPEARAFYSDYVQRAFAELKPIEYRQLDLKDSPLAVDRPNFEVVAEIIREYRPTIVITHHPTMAVLAGHPDHRDAGDLVLRAIMLAMEETFGAAGRSPHQVSRIVCYGDVSDRWKALGQADAANMLVDVETTAKAKEKALLIHGPTFGVTAESVGEGWKRSAQPGYPHLEPFVQLRPVVVDYLRTNPGRPWLGA